MTSSVRSKYFTNDSEMKRKRSFNTNSQNLNETITKLLKGENDESLNNVDNAHCITDTDSPLSGSSPSLNNHLLDDFYDIDCISLAKKLLGKMLVRIDNDGQIMKGKIVETECYLGGIDKASHSYNGRRTPKNKPMFMKPGTAYVYFTYGMYHCFNISSQGDGAAVLIRALEPVEGIDRITKYRQDFGKKRLKPDVLPKDIKLAQLCNGPGKLCVGFNIDRSLTETDLCTHTNIWLEDYDKNEQIKDIDDSQIVISKRIGIDSVGEPWASSPLRFYIYNCPFVSKRDKISENIIKQNLLHLSNE